MEISGFVPNTRLRYWVGGGLNVDNLSLYHYGTNTVFSSKGNGFVMPALLFKLQVNPTPMK